MKNFFSRVSYSFGNEDWETERKALQIQEKDRILCITASGDRPLNLLMNPCENIVCLDANPIQNYLLELKVAAMEHLQFDEYLSFLGGNPSNDRLKVMSQLNPFMSKEAVDFWEKNSPLIKNGILYQGAMERLTKVIAFIGQAVRRKKIEKLFAFNNLEEQKHFVKNQWNTFAWRKVFKLFLSPMTAKFLLEDPGLRNIGESIHPGDYIRQRIEDSLDRKLAKENPLFSLMFLGKVLPDAYPPYLKQNGVSEIKNQLNKITIKTADVIDYLESINEPTFDVFSLSDVSSYIGYDKFVRLLKAMIKTAKPNARFCLRQFLSSNKIPDNLKPFFKQNTVLEKELEGMDNCFVYRFFVGEIATRP